MKAYSRGKMAAKFSTRPQYVKIGALKRASGNYIVVGSVDGKPFKCIFDRSGAFVSAE